MDLVEGHGPVDLLGGGAIVAGEHDGLQARAPQR